MKRIEIPAGTIFHRLTVMWPNGISGSGHSLFFCECSCGKETSAMGHQLLKGTKKSCGCLRFENKGMKPKHGLANTPTYQAWANAKDRCHNEKAKAYPRYGGRGIVMCERWLDSFDNFLADMGLRPEDLTLERVDNELGYCPDNCKWATYTEQNRNRRGIVK